MNKKDLVAAISAKTGLSKTDSEKAWGAAVEALSEALKKGDKVQLIGFGTFKVTTRSARMGRNPQKPNETIEIPASKAPSFKPSQALKDFIK